MTKQVRMKAAGDVDSHMSNTSIYTSSISLRFSPCCCWFRCEPTYPCQASPAVVRIGKLSEQREYVGVADTMSTSSPVVKSDSFQERVRVREMKES